MTDKITYEDVLEYQHLFAMAPSFIMERMARKNSNLVKKFKSSVEAHLNSLNHEQREKLIIILNTEVHELQSVMAEAYRKTNNKQFRILANPKYKQFIELNLNELRKMI